jgi:Arc/MetJ family transcription regulator
MSRHGALAPPGITLAVDPAVCRLAAKELHMATNLALDPDLLERAFRVSGEPTKKAAVTRALQEFVARREQRRVAELFGKFEWHDSFDYKAERSRKK